MFWLYPDWRPGLADPGSRDRETNDGAGLPCQARYDRTRLQTKTCTCHPLYTGIIILVITLTWVWVRRRGYHCKVKIIYWWLKTIPVSFALPLLQEQTKRKLQEETTAQLRSKQKKLDQARHLLNADSSELESVSSAGSYPGRVPGSRIYPAKSEPDLSGMGEGLRSGHHRAMTASVTRPEPAPRIHHTRAMTHANTPNVSRAVPGSTRAKSPPPLKPVSPIMFIALVENVQSVEM